MSGGIEKLPERHHQDHPLVFGSLRFNYGGVRAVFRCWATARQRRFAPGNTGSKRGHNTRRKASGSRTPKKKERSPW